MAQGSDVRRMPLTLREFSQWLDWVKGGKVGSPPTGPEAPPGELFSSLRLEAVAKELLKPLEVDKVRAVEWLSRHQDRGVVTDPQVTTEYRFAVTKPIRRPSYRKVNSDRLKSKYPQLWSQSRDWTPFRQVKFPEPLKVPPAPPLRDALPPAPPVEELPPQRGEWQVSWGKAFQTYQLRLAEAKQHKKIIADGVTVMSGLLTNPEVVAEYAPYWDGHGPLVFEDGVSLQLDRLQFSQDRALQVIETAEVIGGIDLDGIVEVVPEKEIPGQRRLLKINHEGADEGADVPEGLGNPFEGE